MIITCIGCNCTKEVEEDLSKEMSWDICYNELNQHYPLCPTCSILGGEQKKRSDLMISFEAPKECAVIPVTKYETFPDKDDPASVPARVIKRRNRAKAVTITLKITIKGKDVTVTQK